MSFSRPTGESPMQYQYKYTWHKLVGPFYTTYRNYNDKARFERVHHGIVIDIEKEQINVI
jgi:hypothetical protein